MICLVYEEKNQQIFSNAFDCIKIVANGDVSFEFLQEKNENDDFEYFANVFLRANQLNISN